MTIRDRTAVVGVGTSRFVTKTPESPMRLATQAFKAALADAGLERDDVDGLVINIGWPLGVDYDRFAEVCGLRIRFADQSWTHGRFAGPTLQHAAMAVAAGLANVVACVCGVSFIQERGLLGGPGDFEGTREEGGTHEENPVYGLTAPAAGAALAARRYFALYGATSAELAAVPIAFRKHAMLNPQAIMRTPLTLADHQSSRWVVEPLHLFDCCIVSDGAAVVLVTSAERARDGRKPPVWIGGMQGMRAGRDEFLFAPPGLGIGAQRAFRYTPTEDELAVYRMAGVDRRDIDALYTYDAFSPLVWFVLERFGFCGAGEAAAWTQRGRIELGGELPMNTSGGLLSEAHVSGWNSIVEIARQLRGECDERQVTDARVMQWATAWGDSTVFHR
ncbi:MAG: thiolase family protein [Candidatus Rokubacteria bacterium]|nr:thiolase family protein [Candidatus Rokubacteria bacterium]